MKSNRCLYQACWIFLWFIFFILSFYTSEYARDLYQDCGYLLDNWRQLPLVSIYPTYDNCKEGEESLIQYIWPGSEPGCDCIDYEWHGIDLVRQLWENFTPERIIYKGHQCNSTQLHYGCVSIPSTKKAIFDNFPDSTGKPMKLCGTRSGQSYLLTTGQDCEPGQTKCGSDHNFYCSIDPQCPITSFGYSKDAPKDSQSTKLDKEVFWTSNDIKNLPIVEIRVAEGDGVCLKNKERSITKGRADYKLMKIDRTDCNRDPRFVEFYSTNEKAYYQSNSQIINVDKLSRFQVSEQIQWSLYYREYVLWKDECRPQLMKSFIWQVSILWLLILTRIFSVICCLLFLGSGVILVWMLTRDDLSSDWLDNDYDDFAKQLYKKEFAIKFSIHLFILFYLVFIIVPIKMAQRFMDKINQCSDDVTNQSFINFRNSSLSKAESINISFLTMYLIIFLLDLVLAVRYLVKLYYREVGNSFTYQGIQQEDNQHEQIIYNNNY